MDLFNPRMVELARESRRMTQSALARSCAVAQGTISKVEGGVMEPSAALVATLSAVLNYPPAFFMRNSAPPARLLPREVSSLPARDRRAIIAALKIRCSELEDLLRSVDPPPNTIPQLRLGVDVSTPTKAAERVRELWRLPPGPVDNVVSLLEDHGVLILEYDFRVSKMDGLSYSEVASSSLPPIIFVNSESPGDRTRFTMAHELAHHVMHHHEHAMEASEACEMEANEFAAAFLMPERDIRPHFHSRLSIEDLASLKRHWRTSMQALLVRARTVGRINDIHSTRLWKRLSMLGYRTQEPVDVPREKPTLVREIVDAHIAELGYSVEELARLVKLDDSEFSHLYLGERPRLRLLG